MFFPYRKCFHAAYYYLDDPLPQGPTAPLIDWEAPVEVGGEIRSAVPVNEFAKHVAELHADGDIGFSKEYEAIQNESINEEYPSEHSQHPDNKQKNRYLNIIACKFCKTNSIDLFDEMKFIFCLPFFFFI